MVTRTKTLKKKKKICLSWMLAHCICWQPEAPWIPRTVGGLVQPGLTEPLQSADLGQVGYVIQGRACNFAAHVDAILQTVSIFKIKWPVPTDKMSPHALWVEAEPLWKRSLPSEWRCFIRERRWSVRSSSYWFSVTFYFKWSVTSPSQYSHRITEPNL